MGAQSLTEITLDSKREFYEDKMIKEGEEFLLHKYYHLGEKPNLHKMMHLNSLHRAHSSDANCDVDSFIKKQLKLDHNYLKVDNERRCEEFDICYNE